MRAFIAIQTWLSAACGEKIDSARECVQIVLFGLTKAVDMKKAAGAAHAFPAAYP
jgi:hypothetical protein